MVTAYIYTLILMSLLQVSLLTSRGWSLLGSSWRMVARCQITTFRRWAWRHSWTCPHSRVVANVDQCDVSWVLSSDALISGLTARLRESCQVFSQTGIMNHTSLCVYSPTSSGQVQSQSTSNLHLWVLKLLSSMFPVSGVDPALGA